MEGETVANDAMADDYRSCEGLCIWEWGGLLKDVPHLDSLSVRMSSNRKDGRGRRASRGGVYLRSRIDYFDYETERKHPPEGGT